MLPDYFEVVAADRAAEARTASLVRTVAAARRPGRAALARSLRRLADRLEPRRSASYSPGC